MAGIFNTLNTASKGMNAQQTALHTTGHNISNANTEGFSRQRVDMKADLSYTLGGVGQLGTGVKMTGVSRMVDDYVSRQIRQETSSMSQFGTKSETLGQLEIIYNEPSDTGLNFNMAEMFESWQELAKNPESLSSKTIVVEKSNTFADTYNHILSQMESLQDETDLIIDKQVIDLNATLDNINSLNKQIFNIAIKGHTPNDLLDQRDLLLQNMSEITDFKAEFDKYGRASIEIAEVDVLTFDSSEPVDITFNKVDESNTEANITIGEEKVELEKGAIKGYMDAKTEILDVQIADLKEFGQKVAETFNSAHKEDVSTENQIDIFNLDEETGKLSVNSNIIANNNLILAGQDTVENGTPIGDGSRASLIANLRDETVTIGGENSTMENKYNSMITKLGISKQHADNMVSNQDILLGQLQMRRESTSGVSIGEEVTNMVKYQKAFEANARVIATLTEMLDVLINRTGV
jgi:flagellar hook-associated protein 1 FlgK